MKIAVMGWGHFGRAIGSLLDENGVKFTPVDVDKPLKHKVDVLFQMVPTQHIREAFKTNEKFFKPDMIVVNGAKGIEKDTRKLPYQIIDELGPYKNYLSLMGPSFSDGILVKDPTLVSFGYRSKKSADTARDLLQTPYFRVQLTSQYRTLELAGAMKNVYAITCGYAEGLGYGKNTRAKLITLALQEITKFADAVDPEGIDILAAGVVGDLVLTCSSRESRNYEFGMNLASMSQEKALKKAKSTVEGLHTSYSVQALTNENRIRLPLAALTRQLIEDSEGGRQDFNQFVASL